MIQFYPFQTPVILNDDAFVGYGGYQGSTTTLQRQAAYFVAEKEVTSYLGTPLMPVTMTGTVPYFAGIGYVYTDYGYVQNISNFRILDPQGVQLYVLSGTWSFASIHDDTFGYIYVQDWMRYAGLYIPPKQPYLFQWTYTAGLPTGVSTSPDVLLALTKAAQLVLNEMMPVSANEGVGDVGITEYQTIRFYSEKRKPWKNTIFGSSPSAAYIAHLLDGSVRKARRALMLGFM